MLDPVLGRFAAPLLAPTAARLAGWRLQPVALTLAAFLCGAVALLDIGHRDYLLGLALLVAAKVFEVLGGALARRQGLSPRDAYLESVLGLLVTSAMPFAFALAQPERALAAMFLMLGLLVRAATANPAGNAPELVGRTELFVAFAIACIFPDWFSIVAYVTGIACFLSAGLRGAAALAPRP